MIFLKQNTCSASERRTRMDTRIFCNEEWEQFSTSGQVVLCGYYHRYWNPDKTKNQAFDMFSGRILDVKDKQEKGIRYFYQQLDEEICKGVSICVVPSHTQGIQRRKPHQRSL